MFNSSYTADLPPATGHRESRAAYHVNTYDHRVRRAEIGRAHV